MEKTFVLESVIYLSLSPFIKKIKIVPPVVHGVNLGGYESQCNLSFDQIVTRATDLCCNVMSFLQMNTCAIFINTSSLQMLSRF